MTWRSVAVIGSGEADRAIEAAAESVGKLLAASGFALVCGGLGGVMEAACKGAKSAGGQTIGILPGRDPADANEYVDVPIATGLGEARNTIVVCAPTHQVIAIGGGYGTLSEIGFALKIGKRVVGLDTWKILPDLNDASPLLVADSPEEAVRLATE